MREQIRSSVHGEPVLESLFELARSHGDEVYLVGGTLRDLALGYRPADWDFAAVRPYDLASAVAAALGRRVISLGKEVTPTYRIPLDGPHLDVVGLAPGGLEADLRRRDFTVNALAYDPVADRVVDPTGGLKDLGAKLLRAPGREAFREDPLRVVKAFRMLAQFPGFALDLGTRVLLEEARGGLADVAPERVQQELELLLACPSPSAAVRDMQAAGVLCVVFPELKPLEGMGQNRFHHTDVMDHTLLALAELDQPSPSLAEARLAPSEPETWVTLRLAALFHDAGKPKSRTVDDAGEVHFYGHPKLSAEIVREALHRMRFSGERTEAVAHLALNHLRPLALVKTRPRHTALRRLVHDMGDLLPLLLALSLADKRASRGEEHQQNLIDLAEVAREALAVAREQGEELRRLPKLVDGLEAMDLLGLSRPGPELGRALDGLMKKQVEGEVSSREGAVAFLKSWAGRRAQQ